MTCMEATRLLSDAQDRRLSLGDRATLKLHVLMCSGCRNFGRQMASLSQISHAYVRPEALDSSELEKTAEKNGQ